MIEVRVEVLVQRFGDRKETLLNLLHKWFQTNEDIVKSNSRNKIHTFPEVRVLQNLQE